MDRFRVSSGVRAWALPLVFAAGALFVVAGCGPFAQSTPTATATAAPTPVALPSLAPFSATSTSQPSASATSTPLVLAQPTGGGISGTVTLPVSGVPAGTTVTITTSSSPPPGLPPFSITRSAQSASRAALAAGQTGIESITISSSQQLTGNGNPTFSITLPAGYTPSGNNIYLAIWDGTEYADAYAGPGVVNGNTVTLTGTYPLSIPPTQYLYLYEQSAALPSPTPPPTPTPTPVPTPSPTPSPTPTGAVGVGIH